MEFFREHYEKVILSLVLLLLAVAAVYLPTRVQSVNQNIESVIRRENPKPFTPLNTETNVAILEQSQKKLRVKLSGPKHNLFNPVGWIKNKDGNLIKDRFYGMRGPEALIAKKIDPLYFSIEYGNIVTNGAEIFYSFGVTRQADAKKSNRRRMIRRVQIGKETDIFILKEVKGEQARPEEFVLRLLEDNREVRVSGKNSEPYREIAGYTVDLIYPPEERKFNAKRRGDTIKIAKKWYEIVVVSENEVVVKDSRTTKQTTIRVNASE